MDIFTLENLFTLIMLVLLQAVLGFDNLLYISLESKNVPKHKQQYVRKMGVGMAIFLRIALLFILVTLVEYFKDPVWIIEEGLITFKISIHSLIVLAGGAFILYTAMKEIWHMVSFGKLDMAEAEAGKNASSTTNAIIMIVIMNVVFSFDSILSAMALTDVFAVMATAIVIGGILMIWLADKVATFLERNKMYEVLGLFILFLVGVMLISEGGHLADLHLFGNEITQMSKATFYFVIVILVLTDIVQGRYQKKLIREQKVMENAIEKALDKVSEEV